jgi:hypothetical protein
LECAPNIAVMKHGQNEGGWREKSDKRTQTDQPFKGWMRRGRRRRLLNDHKSERNGDSAQK